MSSTKAYTHDPVNGGLPYLDLKDRPLGYFEFWPSWFFYAPVVFYWIYLSLRYRSISLPMLANPTIAFGGMVGESKAAVLDLAVGEAKDAILPYFCHLMPEGFDEDSLDTLLLSAKAQGITFPLIVKPDLGCRGAGVQKVESRQELERYLKTFSVGRVFMLQKLAPYSAEVGLFYERMPSSKAGKITSITLKYAPYVTGDGKRSIAMLIQDDPRAGRLTHIYFPKNKSRLDEVPKVNEHVQLAFAGSHSRGSIFRDGREYITPALERRIDELMHNIPGFHYGRMDIKFKDIESLVAGKNLAIIEINGVSSEATHIWDSRTRLLDVFKTLLQQYRTLFKMGDLIRASGGKPPKMSKMLTTWLAELRAVRDLPPSN